MSGEDFVAKLIQILKNEEENLRKNYIIINAQLQYNLKLQETLKELIVKHTTQNKTKVPRRRK